MQNVMAKRGRLSRKRRAFRLLIGLAGPQITQITQITEQSKLCNLWIAYDDIQSLLWIIALLFWVVPATTRMHTQRRRRSFLRRRDRF
jgi:hypothetical protein